MGKFSDIPTSEEILNSLQDLILVKGPKSELLWANESFLNYYGCTLEELVGLIDAEHSDPDDTLQYVKDDRIVFSTGRTLRVKEPISQPDGGTSFFDTVKSPIKKGDSVVYTVGSSRPLEEVEQLEEFEEELRSRKASLRELRALISEIPRPMAMLDVHGRIVSHSRAWTEFWDEDRVDLTGEPITHWGDRLALKSAVDRAVGEFRQLELNECKVLGGSQELLVNVVIQPWELGWNEVGGVIVLLDDITQAKQHERQLELQATELQRKNEDLDQFVHAASHDLKAPLRGIKNISNWLLEDLSGTLPEASEAHLRELSVRIDKMEQLLLGLLKYSRAGRQAQSIEEFSLEELFLDVKRAVAAPPGFRFSLKGGELRLKTFRLPLAQVLQNLVDNAIRHHDKAEGHILISAERENGYLQLTVEDDGPGIEAEHHKRIFEMFQTLDPKGDGDGVGLALVHRLTVRAGGSVKVESELGKGTRMVIGWPLS